MSIFYKKVQILIVLLSPFLLFSYVQAQTIFDMLEQVVEEHDLIQAAEAGKEAADQIVKQAKSEWYPHVSAVANLGRENIDPPAPASSTAETRNTQTLRATQLIYDFGRAGSGVKRARAGLNRSEAGITAARQEIIMRGLAAYLNVYRHARQLDLAEESERRIVRLTGIEETLVTKGAGLASDVLQAKSQLAGAKALRVLAEGQLSNALNRFRTVFGYVLTDEQIKEMVIPAKPLDHIPDTIDEALNIALENSIDLLMTAADIDMARHEIRFRESAYYPSLHLVGEFKRKENDAGILGTRNESLGMVELSWNLFSGGKDVAAVREARHRVRELEKTRDNLEHVIQERVLIAWQNLITSRENAKFSRHQADIMEEFLELAKRERKLGTRSLLDVLSGEVTHLNALSNAVSADIDKDLAIFNMLYAMGELELDVLR